MYLLQGESIVVLDVVDRCLGGRGFGGAFGLFRNRGSRRGGTLFRGAGLPATSSFIVCSSAIEYGIQNDEDERTVLARWDLKLHTDFLSWSPNAILPEDRS